MAPHTLCCLHAPTLPPSATHTAVASIPLTPTASSQGVPPDSGSLADARAVLEGMECWLRKESADPQVAQAVAAFIRALVHTCPTRPLHHLSKCCCGTQTALRGRHGPFSAFVGAVSVFSAPFWWPQSAMLAHVFPPSRVAGSDEALHSGTGPGTDADTFRIHQKWISNAEKVF